MTVGVTVGAVVLLLLRRRQLRSFSRRSTRWGAAMDEPLVDVSHSDHMVSVDGSDTKDSDGFWTMSSATTFLFGDVRDFEGIMMAPVVSTATVPRYGRDLDGVSPSALKLLLSESAAHAFIGEGSSLVLNLKCTNIQAHPRHSGLEFGGGHVEQGPH